MRCFSVFCKWCFSVYLGKVTTVSGATLTVMTEYAVFQCLPG